MTDPTIRERLREPIIGHDQKHDGIAPVFDWRGVCLVCSLVRDRDTLERRVRAAELALKRSIERMDKAGVVAIDPVMVEARSLITRE